MIYAILPIGNNFGWGTCGKYLVKELSEFAEVKYITEQFGINAIGDEMEFHFLKSKLIGKIEADQISNGSIKRVNHPVLQAINNHSLMPCYGIKLKGSFKAGYTFFEENLLLPEYIQNGRDNYDIVITGSKWCEEVLRKHGLETVTTVIQGVDPRIFNPSFSDKEFFKDRFVVFSGGKFELRKGHDLAIKAYKALQDRHDDVMLVNSWYNMWPDSMNTMAASQYIKFEIESKDYVTTMNKILRDNGIDLNRVITMLPRPNAMMPRIYKNTDVGLFPNRCEGGTNLVLMEYMACGKPVIASYNSGHKDILNSNNSKMIEDMKPMEIKRDARTVAVWDDPNLEETISHLEWAYQNKDELKLIGTQAGKDLGQHTWKKSAEHFFKIVTNTC